MQVKAEQMQQAHAPQQWQVWVEGLVYSSDQQPEQASNGEGVVTSCRVSLRQPSLRGSRAGFKPAAELS